MAPILLLLLVVVFLFTMIGSAFTNVVNGGQIVYDESAFQAYADDQYAAEFVNSSAYEDNLLIVIATNKDADDYYCIAWVGDNVHTKINLMFGDETSTFGHVVQGTINSEYYAYSLDSNLATVMTLMSEKIVALELDSSFNKESDQTNVTESHLTNHTDLSLTEETVNAALRDFTEQTDIPTVIVVDTMENIFGKSLSIADISIVIMLVGFAIFAIYLIVRNVRRYNANKKQTNGAGDGNDNGNGGNYNRDYRGNYNRDERNRNGY